MRKGTGHHGAHRRAGRNAASRPAGRSRRTPPPRLTRRRLADNNTLTGRASRALGWSFGSTLLNKISMFGVGVMLARLLGPHVFGTYAVAYVGMFALLNFNELGVSLAIVRWPGDPAEIVPTVTTISLVVSAIIYVGCFFAAPVYTSAMGAPAATPVVRVLAVLVLSDGFTNTPAALLQRNFRQGRRAIADQVNVWLGTGLTVALAWSGFGAMSLAIGRVIGCVAGAVLLLVFAPESLRLGFDRAKARALLRFGLPLCGANFAAFAVGSVDQIVVGHIVGTVALGFYVLALNLAGWPSAIFTQPVRTVGPAVFARLQHDRAAMRSTFLSAAGLLCAVALPICLLISGSARPLISFVYGTRWLPATGPLLWLALLGGVQVFFLLAYDFLVVLQRSRFLLATQLVWLLALVPALVAGARADGIYGASMAEFAVAAGCVLPWYLMELRKAGIPLGALGRHLFIPAAGAVLVGLTAVVAAQVAPTDFSALAASGVAMAAIVGLLAYRMRTVLAQLRSPSAEPVAASPANMVTFGAVPAAMGAAGHVAEDPSPIREVVGVHNEAYGHWLSRGTLLSRSAYHFQTGPLPVYRDVLGYPPSRQDLRAASPLYWQTVAALRWDPANRPEDTDGDQSLARRVADPATRLAIIPPAHDGMAPGMARGNSHRLTTATAEVRNITREETP